MRIVVYPNDHRPAHVHVIGPAHEAVFELNGAEETATVRENYGFARRDLDRIERRLLENLARLLGEWDSIHGTE
ncbi:MAG: DUF4160 domain-containing protein [Terracidiphilus sp.]